MKGAAVRAPFVVFGGIFEGHDDEARRRRRPHAYPVAADARVAAGPRASCRRPTASATSRSSRTSRWSRSAGRASSTAARTRSCRWSTSSPRSSGSHKMVIGVGGGTRVRHTISIAIDLGLPTGGIAQLVGAMEELNAILLNALLAPHGSMPMQRDHFWDLPLYFDAGITPIAISVPPYPLLGAAADRGRRADARLGLRPVPARRGARHEAGRSSSRTRTACTTRIRRSTPTRRRSGKITLDELIEEPARGEHPRRASCIARGQRRRTSSAS